MALTWPSSQDSGKENFQGLLSADFSAAQLCELREALPAPSPWNLPVRIMLPAGRNINMDEAWHL